MLNLSGLGIWYVTQHQFPMPDERVVKFTGPRALAYLVLLRDTFPLIRMFLDDADDARICYLVTEKQIRVADLVRIVQVLETITKKLSQQYEFNMEKNQKVNDPYFGEDHAALINILLSIVTILHKLHENLTHFISNITKDK